MQLSLDNLLLQRPHISTIQNIISNKTDEDGQIQILSGLQHCDNIYKEQILKLLITKCEASNVEVSPDVWEVYYELKSPSVLQEMKCNGGENKVVYSLPRDEKVEIYEDRSSLVAHGDTGHRTWESSLVLTEFICTDLLDCKLNKVVELGAGTGLVSLALTKLNICTDIWCTDGSQMVIDKFMETKDMNSVGDSIHPLVYSWGDDSVTQTIPKNATIFAGDILYGMTEGYTAILNMLIELQPKTAYFCNPIRNPESYELFFKLCNEFNIKATKLRRYEANGEDDTKYMFLSSIPPIPLELIKLDF